jgi:hypothetical protein
LCPSASDAILIKNFLQEKAVEATKQEKERKEEKRKEDAILIISLSKFSRLWALSFYISDIEIDDNVYLIVYENMWIDDTYRYFELE